MEDQKEANDHIWGAGWEDSDKPHPGFGGSYNIYGGYVDQCEKCGIYHYEFDDKTHIYYNKQCEEKIRD